MRVAPSGRHWGACLARSNGRPCEAPDTVALIPVDHCGSAPRQGSDRFKDAQRLASRYRSETKDKARYPALATLRRTATLELSWQTPASLDRAVASLETAAREHPEPDVLNDLAVAYLEVAARDQNGQLLVRALDLVERSLEADSVAAAPLFNRAIILNRLNLLGAARQTWTRYLSVDGQSPWAGEARTRLEVSRRRQGLDPSAFDSLLREVSLGRLPPPREVEALSARAPQAAREFAMDQLLPAWGTSVINADTAQATRLLALARTIASAFDTPGLDQTLPRAIHAIEQAAGLRTATLGLARGHADYGTGRRAHDRGDYENALPLLLGAAELLRQQASSTAGSWAEFYAGSALVRGGRYNEADRVFRALLASADSLAEPALIGKAIGALGVTQLLRGFYEGAIRQYDDALPFFSRAHELQNEGVTQYYLAEALHFAGQDPAGWEHALRGLRQLEQTNTSIWLRNHLSTVAAYARTAGYHRAALVFHDEALEVARRLDIPQYMAWVLRGRAFDNAALNRIPQARADLDAAMRSAHQMEKGPGRARVEGDVLLAMGNLLRVSDPAGAQPVLARAVETYRDLRLDRALPEALYSSGLAALAVGDRKQARLSLDEAVRGIEAQQATFQSSAIGATFAETVEAFFDEMISLELAESHSEAAFGQLERSRDVFAAGPHGTARVGPGAQPISLSRLTHELPDSLLLMEYAVMRDRILIWTASRQGWRSRTVPVSRDSLAVLVDRLTPVGRSARAEWSNVASARLFDLLIRPIADDLEGMSQLAVVPDRELYRVPFAALRSDAAAPYLIERFAIRTVPSAAFFLQATAAAARVRRTASRGAVVVGNPAFDHARLPLLTDLGGAREEAEAVAARYAPALLLTDTAATRRRLLDALPHQSVLHFAGHAVFNNMRPEFSYLALAPEVGDEGGGLLYASEIAQLHLSTIQIVVLSACSTLNLRSSRAGGVSGLSSSFLRAGAPATVSTLWDVTDETTRVLLEDFHGEFSRGVPAAIALRNAQVRALSSSNPELRSPWAWAAFSYAGS